MTGPSESFDSPEAAAPGADLVRVDGDWYSGIFLQLQQNRVAERLAEKDPTLWGPEAEAEASIRLGWVDLPASSRPLLAEVESLRAQLLQEGLDHVVLAGMGGSSLAPEVITRTAGVQLTVLDTTDPNVIRRALGDRLDRTVVVVSSKSGGTVETDSQRRAYLQAFADAGIRGASRIVAVTDPGSPLAELAEKENYRALFLADENVGGRYSALSAFGLVPSGLAGADIAALLDDAHAVQPTLAASTPENPALTLGAALGAAHNQGRDKVVIGAGGSPIRGFGAWAEQLIAESTGKLGRGLLPVDLAGTGRETPGWLDTDDSTYVSLGEPDFGAPQVTSDGPMGAMFLLWETAIAIAGRVIEINPFDQPNVEAAKQQSRQLLENPSAGDGLPLAFTEGRVEVYGEVPAESLPGLFAALPSLLPPGGYIALQAYLDRDQDSAAEQLQGLVAAGSGLQTTFGWGPRFLHSTGQYHKGGHQNGGFVQLTGAVDRDLGVPDRSFTFGQLQRAQAAGDAVVLGQAGRPVIRLHLQDRAVGLMQLLEAAS